MSMFKRKEITMESDYHIHFGWGDHIEWLNPEQFEKPMTRKSEIRVWGHLSDKPKKGQTLLGEFKRSFMKFEFIEVEYNSDPPDMFFATVKFVKQFIKKEQQ